MESMESDMATSAHHVHFPESLDFFGGHDLDILVNHITNNTLDVHLGFLQIGHRYEITFQFSSTHERLAVRGTDPPNLNVRVLQIQSDFNPEQEGCTDHKVTLELLAHKEKLLREQLILESCNDSLSHLTVLLQARVLGRGRGTPLLKSGIRCIGMEMQDDSDFSDWSDRILQ